MSRERGERERRGSAASDRDRHERPLDPDERSAPTDLVRRGRDRALDARARRALFFEVAIDEHDHRASADHAPLYHYGDHDDRSG